MFLGHFGVALAAKKAAPRASLGVLVLAAQLADLLWPIFLLMGWEQVRIAPGFTRMTPLDFVSYPWSHSLLMLVFWGVLLGGIYFALLRDARGAAVVTLCVPSHWVLDWIVHRPDLPLIPGGKLYGLGVWDSLPLTLTAELGLFAGGIAIYLIATRTKDRAGNFALWSLLGVLLAIYLAAAFGPPPPNVHVLAVSGLAIWLTIPWSAWADARRDSASLHAGR